MVVSGVDALRENSVRMQDTVSGQRGAGVVADDADQRGGARLGGKAGVGPREKADQVVHPVAAGRVLLHEGNSFEGKKNRRDRVGGQPGEVGGRADADVGSGCEAEQFEYLGVLRRERAQGPRQDRGDTGVAVVERAHVGEFGGQRGQREAGVFGGAGGQDSQRQGEAGATGDELFGSVGVGIEIIRAEPGEQDASGV